MNLLHRMLSVFKRVMRGEDIILVQQSVDAWNRQFKAGRWDRLMHSQPNTKRISQLIEGMVRTQPLSVLDVGCGNGGLAALLASNAQISYCGLDASEVAIEIAKSLVPSARFEVSNAETPSVDLGIFDVIVFNEILYYTNPHTVLPRYRAHAGDTTRIIISVVQFSRSWFIWRRIRKYITRMHTEQIEANGRTWQIAMGEYA
jgi:2-polyprenyl-3-methyl-5-hydroxy-6-metoxy-1,4-benzoquinol methylase